MLAFALGIYIPVFTNMAILAGAFVAYIVGQTGGSEKVRKARQDQGVLIASGLMAGAAIFGIVTAILRQPAIGAPIQYISVGEKLSLVPAETTGDLILQSTTPDWYERWRLGARNQPGDVPGPRRRLLPAGKEGRRWVRPRGRGGGEGRHIAFPCRPLFDESTDLERPASYGIVPSGPIPLCATRTLAKALALDRLAPCDRPLGAVI